MQSFGAISAPFVIPSFIFVGFYSDGMSRMYFTFDRRFLVSGSIAALVVERLGCDLAEGTLVRIGRLNNL